MSFLDARNGIPVGLGSVAGIFAGRWTPSYLFGAGEQGAWYDPSDISTLFQDSAGTTPVTAVEQPVGLMLDKSKGLVLGPELVTNGGFDSGATGWTDTSSAGGSVTFSGGIATLTNTSGVPRLRTVITSVVGKCYKIVVSSVDISTSTPVVNIGSTNGGNDFIANSFLAANNTATYYVFATTTTISVQFSANAVGYLKLDNISVKELPGNHAFQATSTKRPLLSARYNLLTKTEDLSDTSSWTAVNGTATVVKNFGAAPDGTTTSQKITFSNANMELRQSIASYTGVLTETLWFKGTAGETIAYGISATSGTADQSLTFNGDWQKITYSPTASAAVRIWLGTWNSATARVIEVWHPDLRVSNNGVGLPAYQRVNTSTDYDTVGFKPYLKFDGVDDALATNSIDFTSGDKMFVGAAVRKLSDAAWQMFCELGTNSYSGAAGTFGLGNSFSGGDYIAVAKGSTGGYYTPSTFSAPISNVVSTSFDISGADLSTEIIPRINGVVKQTGAVGGLGTGNFANQSLYIGSRAGTSLPFNGQMYGLIIRAAANTTAQTQASETYLAQKAGIAL